MATSAWPEANRRKQIGARIARHDGPAKATGAARYAYDMNPEGMLFAKMLQCPHGHARVISLDASAAEAMPGVAMVLVEKDKDGNIPETNFDGAIIATVAATTEEIAEEALAAIEVEYEMREVITNDREHGLVSGRAAEKGDAATAMDGAEVVSEGYYGLPTITHCCLESHGQVCEFRDGELYIWPSTQNVSGYAGSVRTAADLPNEKIHVDVQYMGGGFGSKFVAGRWGTACVEIAKATGKPVKLMLDRAQELKGAGHRPSNYGTVKIGLKKDGTITGFHSDVWGTNGQSRFTQRAMPYCLTEIPNIYTKSQGIVTNRGNVQAWRAPNHPQAAYLTMSALEDAAAKIGMDALEFLKKNLVFGDKDRKEYWAEELDVAAEMIGYASKAHPRGDKTPGNIKRGIGISFHMWGGKGGASTCDLTVNPTGTVGAKIGSQDLGVGTRTCIAQVAAETLGIPIDMITVEIGRNSYPSSGASGGSTTIGGISTSTRDAATKALNVIMGNVAPGLGVTPDKLEAWNGRIQEIGNPSNGLSWENACKSLGQMALTKQGSNPTEDGTELTTADVGGVQMAEVSVDIETGIVTMENFVAVQDIGLIINAKLSESQIHGAMIMGVAWALYEECVYDGTTGKMLNPDMEFYQLATLGDIGNFQVKLMDGEKYQSRGVIGIGEPPAISPGAAIGNAVANAIGVRVPELPLTPDRVLQALKQGGMV